MKRFLSVVLAIALLLACAPVIPLTANAETSGYYTYTVSNGKATITDCNTSISGDITIPATLGGYPVTGIGDDAFRNCSSLTSVAIPDSVTSIGWYAFYNCSSLTSVEIPNSVTSIGYGAFQYCGSLTSVEIPNSVTSIGGLVFYNCSSLTSVEIPNSVTSIAFAVFQGCSSLESVVIPDSVTSISDHAFSDCSSLTSVEIPNSVTFIGDYALAYCSSLTSIEIPDSVTSIGEGAFSGCSSLTGIWVDEENPFYCSDEQGVLYNKDKTTLIQAPGGITECMIPNSVTSIGDDAFEYCSSLTSVEIPSSVTSIGYSAFEYCSSLTSVVIPDSVTSIGNLSFRSCSSLTSVVIPDSVTSIGYSAFSYCSSLSHVAYTGTQSQWSRISIGSDNYNLTDATRHYETSFEIIVNCVEAGVYCPVCKEFIVRTERGNHQETPVPGYAPTCTESGLTDGTVCTICGEVVTQQVEIPATGHDTVNGACQNCDYDKNVVILEGDGETFYSTVENALAAATSGTIKLLADATTDVLIVKPGIALDLNGYTLSAQYLFVMQDAAVLDGGASCTGRGLLKVAKDNLVYAQENGNGIIPVWNGTDGYLFTRVTFQQMANPLGNGAAQYLFLPSFSNGAVTALMADGGLDNGLKFKVNLVWNNGQIQQLYTYEEAFVKQVFDGTYQWVFTLNVTGIGSIEDMVARPVVVTDCIVQATANGTALIGG